ncbi:hypothetical protein FAZ95_38680 [Trinickia violacea]|uniref:Large polyvalent protein associated domain-containing protein n=1 Tax=Trinickia violacea TaxID=2571746 RepID=A0A4P8J444_9BURK|nr:hypothetical protein FAZ95_38680 [Trinickia violacea]
MGRRYLSCAETAKLVRQALKEAFPGVKFGVRSSTYSGGASISVRWEDGPNTAQVEAITNRFKGAYFDGSIDYKGSVYHMMDGQQISFGADYIFTSRSYTEASIERAIDTVFRHFRANFREAGLERPTVAQYRKGQLMHFRFADVQQEISQVLWKHSDRLSVAKSATAAKVFVTHDDGYSRSCGCGISFVPQDL